MATPASDVIDRVMRGFRQRSQVDVLTADPGASGTTINFQGLLNNWGQGMMIEVEQEVMLITAVPSTTSATVVRGWLDTDAVAHASGTPIYIRPRIFSSDLLDLINDCLVDLFGRDLFAVGSQTITYDPSIIGYNLDADAVEILRVDSESDSSAKYWEPVSDWLEVDNADTGEFTNGKAVMLRKALPPGRFRVVYAKPFTTLTAVTEDLEAAAGLRPYMIDLPYYYAMNRTMVDLERHRSQVEGAESHQRAQDSPPFLALRTGEWYQARYDDRVRSARTHLLREVKRIRTGGYGS